MLTRMFGTIHRLTIHFPELGPVASPKELPDLTFSLCRHQALEFLKPVLDEDQVSRCLPCLLVLRYQETLAVRVNIAPVSRWARTDGYRLVFDFFSDRLDFPGTNLKQFLLQSIITY